MSDDPTIPPPGEQPSYIPSSVPPPIDTDRRVFDLPNSYQGRVITIKSAFKREIREDAFGESESREDAGRTGKRDRTQ